MKISKSHSLALFVLLLLASWTLAPMVLAASSSGGSSAIGVSGLKNPLGTTDIAVVIGRIISFIMNMVGALALMLMVYAGFSWMTARGADQPIKKAQKIMLWTSAGLILMFFAYIVLRFVLQLITG
jgi:hypothetical protein